MKFKKGDWVIYRDKYRYKNNEVVGNISNRVMIVVKDSYEIYNLEVVDVIVKADEPPYTISITYLTKLKRK